MNNNKTFRIILAVAIIIAFFLPWFAGASALDMVITRGYEESSSTTIVRYSFLLIPLFAAIVLIRSVQNKGASFLVRFLPLLVTAILTALFIAGVKYMGASNEEMRGFLYVLGYGYYINLIASVLLIFI